MQINVNINACQQYGQEGQRLSSNLANSFGVYHQMCETQSKNSGSEYLQAITADVKDLQESMDGIASTFKKANMAIEEYTKELARKHRN